MNSATTPNKNSNKRKYLNKTHFLPNLIQQARYSTVKHFKSFPIKSGTEMPTTVKHCFKGVSLIIELDNKYKYYKI